MATVGTSEDGVMTSELLVMLFAGHIGEDVKMKELQRFNKPWSNKMVSQCRNRVFLIGENRWEDSSRLTQKNKPISSATTTSTKKSISCRGEGRIMCIECDGTGEPNIEPQFLGWVGEDMKCPYCEDLGSIVCDVCEGKTVVES